MVSSYLVSLCRPPSNHIIVVVDIDIDIDIDIV